MPCTFVSPSATTCGSSRTFALCVCASNLSVLTCTVRACCMQDAKYTEASSTNAGSVDDDGEECGVDGAGACTEGCEDPKTADMVTLKVRFGRSIVSFLAHTTSVRVSVRACVRLPLPLPLPLPTNSASATASTSASASASAAASASASASASAYALCGFVTRHDSRALQPNRHMWPSLSLADEWWHQLQLHGLPTTNHSRPRHGWAQDKRMATAGHG